MKKVFMAVLAFSIVALPSLAEARKRGGSKAMAKRPAATAPAKTTTAQKPAAAPAQANNAAPANANAAAPTAQAQPQQKGNGMMGNIMSTAAGVAIGSVIADSLTNDAVAEEVPTADVVADEATAPAPESVEPAAE